MIDSIQVVRTAATFPVLDSFGVLAGGGGGVVGWGRGRCRRRNSVYSSDGSGIIRLAREIFVCVRWSKGMKCVLYCRVE